MKKKLEHIIPILDIFYENIDNCSDNIDPSDFDGEDYDLFSELTLSHRFHIKRKGTI